MSAVLPMGGMTDVNASFRGTKVVDHANPNSKFSRRPVCLNNRSSVFSNDPNPVSSRSASVGKKTDPFHSDPNGTVATERASLKITGMMQFQETRTSSDEPKIRTRGAGVPRQPEMAKDRVLFTAFGTCYGGKAVGPQTNRETAPTGLNDEALKGSARFRLTPRASANVLLPQTLKDATPPQKVQRFGSSQRHAQASLFGVMGTMPARPTVTHKVTPPWSIE